MLYQAYDLVMINPFDPLITVAEFKAKVNDTSVNDDKAIAFLTRSYQMFLSFGMPISMNGSLRTVVEESIVESMGGSKSEYNFIGKPAKIYISLDNPISSLISVKIKNQTQDENMYSPELPKNNFIYMENSCFIQSVYNIFDNYASCYWVDEELLKYVQVTYTTGIKPTAKADILEALYLIFIDLGYNTAPEDKLNEPRRTRVISDDTAWYYDWTNVKTIENYIRNKQHIASLLHKYRGIRKLLF